MRVRQNDTVQVISGKDAGKRGKVQQVIPRDSRVMVEGVNIVKRHQRATATMRQAGIIERGPHAAGQGDAGLPAVRQGGAGRPPIS